MNSEKERRIGERAYALWEAEGQPHGRHEEHWRRAAREIEAEESARAVMTRPARRTSQRTAPNSGSRPAQRERKRHSS